MDSVNQPQSEAETGRFGSFKYAGLRGAAVVFIPGGKPTIMIAHLVSGDRK